MLNLTNFKNMNNIMLLSYLKQLNGVNANKANIIQNDIGLGCDVRLKSLDQFYLIYISQWLNDNDFNLNRNLKKKQSMSSRYKFFTNNFYKNEFN